MSDLPSEVRTLPPTDEIRAEKRLGSAVFTSW